MVIQLSKIVIGLLSGFITLSTCATSGKSNKQPRIITQDGHLIFQTGDNFNITFKASGQGAVKINNEDLMDIANRVKKNEKDMSNMKQQLNIEISDIKTKLLELMENPSKPDSPGEKTVQDFIDELLNITQKMAFLEEQQFTQSFRSLREDFILLQMQFQTLNDVVHQINMLLIMNECNSNPCRNGGTCIDIFNSFMCNCPPSWEGLTCSDDVNECDRFQTTSLGCQNGADCVNTNGSFICECTANWHGVLCTEQHDDCTGTNSHALCGHGTCVNEERMQTGQAKYRCLCNPGWTHDVNTSVCMVDIDECRDTTRPPCSNDPPSQCINIPGSFYCGPCQSGYNGNGYDCLDLNECLESNGGCSIDPFVECINTPGSRTCGQCPPDYDGDGVTCTFVGLCKKNNGGCHVLATCEEGVGNEARRNRTCTCPQNYIGNGEGKNGCTTMYDNEPCSKKNCLHGLCQSTGGSYKCVCNPGYTGIACSSVLQCTRKPCLNGGTCEGDENYFVCTCSPDYTGKMCEVLAITRNCNATFTATTGTFSSPGFPISYPNNAMCFYIITGRPDQFIIVEFDKSFHITTSFMCVDDHLTLYQGNSTAGRFLGKFCGYVAPGSVSTQGSLFVRFVSDTAFNTKGFKATYRIADCYKDYTEGNGEIFSPGWPGNYPINARCVIRIMVPENYMISIFFNSFHIEFHLNCLFDFLEIREGGTESGRLIGRYCGNVVPFPIYTGNSLWLKLQTDGSRTHQGFHITYTSSPKGCGGNLTGVNGTFANPGYPTQYTNNLTCEWLVIVAVGQRVRLEFVDFQVSMNPQCSSDYVAVYDGMTDTTALIGRYCGHDKPAVFVSVSNVVFVKFATGTNTTDKGFKAKFGGVL